MIDGPRVWLRPLGRAHLARTLQWANDPELAALLDRARPVEPEEHQRWFQGLAAREDCRYFAIERAGSGEHIGNVWLWDIVRRHRRAEVRVLIGTPGGENKGLGTEALGLLASYAFSHLDLHKLYAYVLAFNPRAKRAFEKAGYQVEGILRSDRWARDRYVDVYLLGRLREDPA